MNGLPNVNGLRHRITLQARSVANDGFGQESQTWLDVATCYAQVEPLSGITQAAGEAVQAPIKYLIFIRYRDGVTARMRAIYRGLRLEIDSVMDVGERHAWLQLECTQGATAG